MEPLRSLHSFELRGCRRTGEKPAEIPTFKSELVYFILWCHWTKLVDWNVNKVSGSSRKLSVIISALIHAARKRWKENVYAALQIFIVSHTIVILKTISEHHHFYSTWHVILISSRFKRNFSSQFLLKESVSWCSIPKPLQTHGKTETHVQ